MTQPNGSDDDPWRGTDEERQDDDGGAAEYHAGANDDLPWDKAMPDPDTLPLFDGDTD